MIWVSIIGVIASSVIAVAALWGERIRAALFRPDLRLELVSSLGERERFGLEATSSGQAMGPVPASRRTYRLRVSNRARYPAALDVEVLLTHFALRGPDGRPQESPTGSLPLMWRYQSLYPRNRTIGHTTALEAELLFVSEGVIQLAPMDPPGFSLTMYGAQHFWATAIARGFNGESRSLRLRVDWDGLWEPGDIEMSRHLTIRID
jgi:hypothetical protein